MGSIWEAAGANSASVADHRKATPFCHGATASVLNSLDGTLTSRLSGRTMPPPRKDLAVVAMMNGSRALSQLSMDRRTRGKPARRGWQQKLNRPLPNRSRFSEFLVHCADRAPEGGSPLMGDKAEKIDARSRLPSSTPKTSRFGDCASSVNGSVIHVRLTVLVSQVWI
jgi:hypothetical protein